VNKIRNITPFLITGADYLPNLEDLRESTVRIAFEVDSVTSLNILLGFRLIEIEIYNSLTMLIYSGTYLLGEPGVQKSEVY